MVTGSLFAKGEWTKELVLVSSYYLIRSLLADWCSKGTKLCVKSRVNILRKAI